MSSTSGSYGEYRPPRGEPVIQYHIAEHAPQQYNIHTKEWQVPAEFSSRGGHSRLPIYVHHIVDVGIFRDTLAPSLALHSSLAVAAWGAGRYLNRVDAKDWLWPSGMLINAWWSSVGRRFFIEGVPLSAIGKTISWPERLLLAGVTVWGGRLFYRIVNRSLKNGEDDRRYIEVKKEEGFWNKALVSMFLPEALFQTFITLPFTAPFRHQGGVMSGHHPLIQSFAVGMFTAGLALEIIADNQLESHKQSANASGLQREGVWSIVRHPNYLGDAVMHAAMPLLLFGSDMLAPIELLGPVANYIYLRYVGGDVQTESSQEAHYEKEDPIKLEELRQYRKSKNSFWPSADEIKNEWTWYIIGVGVAGAVVERAVRAVLH